MANLPTGTVTFLFTDIEDSTRLWQEHPHAMQTSLARHHAILRQAIKAHNGHVFQIIGDAFCAAFGQAPDALAAALNAQRALHAEIWKKTGPLRVRMGLHSGVAEIRGDEYLSCLTLVRVQRVMSAGHGGQTLLSPTTAELVRHQLPSGTLLRDLGKQRLRGLIQLERIFQVIVPDLPSQFPPLRVVESKEIVSESNSVLERLVRGRLVARHRELQKLQGHWSLAQQAHCHPSLALIATDLNGDNDAKRIAQRGLRRGERLGQVALHSYSLHAMGYWQMRCLKWEKAVRYYQQMLTLLRPTENRIISLYSYAYAAEAFLGSGRIAESMELIDEAFAVANLAQAAHLRALSRRIQAQAFTKLERPGKAATAFEEAIAELNRLGSRLELGRAHYHRAEMLLEIGEFEQARVDAECAVNILENCGAKRDTQKAQALLA